MISRNGIPALIGGLRENHSAWVHMTKSVAIGRYIPICVLSGFLKISVDFI